MHKLTVMIPEECQKEIAGITENAFEKITVIHIEGITGTSNADEMTMTGIPVKLEPLKKKPGWPKGKKRGPRKPKE